jgi:hypothetical protein
VFAILTDDKTNENIKLKLNNLIKTFIQIKNSQNHHL